MGDPSIPCSWKRRECDLCSWLSRYFFLSQFDFLLIFGYGQSSMLHLGFLQLQQAQASLNGGFSSSLAQALSSRASAVTTIGLSSCGIQALLLHGMWGLPEQGSNQCPWHCKCKFLTTDHQGSRDFFSLIKGCPLLPSPFSPAWLQLAALGTFSIQGPPRKPEEKDECSTAGSRELEHVLVSEDSMMAIHTGTVFCCLVHCSGPFLPPPLGRMGQPAATFSLPSSVLALVI